MATNTSVVTQVTGQAWIRSADGSLIPIHQGMEIPADANIVTADGASVQLQANGAAPITVGENRDVQLGAEVAQTDLDPATNAAVPADPDAERILAALEDGSDPFDELDPTAAVLQAGTDGAGGSSFTRLVSIVETTSPLGLEYPRALLPSTEDVRLGGFGGLGDSGETTPPPGLPTIDIPDTNNDFDDPAFRAGTFNIYEDQTRPVEDEGQIQMALQAVSANGGGVTGEFGFTVPAGLQHIQFTFDGETGVPGGSEAPHQETRLLSLSDLLALSPDNYFEIDTDRGILHLTGVSSAVDPDSGELVYTVKYEYWSDGAQNHDKEAGNDTAVLDEIQIDIVDMAGKTASGVLGANILDTVPEAVDDVNTITEDDVEPVEGNVIGGVEGEGADILGADDVHVSNIVNSKDEAEAISDSAGVVSILGQYGTLTIRGDGKYTYKLNNDLPEVQGLTEDGDPLFDVFTYTLKDADGDESTANLTIQINGKDDTSVIDFDPESQATVPDGLLVVDEVGLRSPTDGNTSNVAPSSFAITASDGIATLSLTYTDKDGVEQTVQLTLDEIRNLDTEDPYELITDKGVLWLMAYHPDPAVDNGKFGGIIDYQYQITDPQTHGPDGSSTDDELTDIFGISVKGIGDSEALGTLTVTIVDDVPVAKADTGDVDATGTLTVDAASGVLANDVLGADGAEVVGVVKGEASDPLDDTDTLDTTVPGTYGTLTLQADGSYVYVRTPGTPGGAEDVFTYTIKDGDGDLSYATLTITLDNMTPSVTLPTAGAEGTVVHEAGLPPRGTEPGGSGEMADDDGTNDSDKRETTSGTIEFTSVDGVSVVSLGGHELSTTSTTFAAETVNGVSGQLTAHYSYNPADGTGTIHYSYTLLDNTSGDDTAAEFAVVVTDRDGESAGAANLTITVVDDEPVANPDTWPTTITGETTLTGLLTNDTFGADGVDTTTPGQITVTNGAHGTVVYNNDGTFTYTPTGGVYKGSDSFTYTIMDSDGDTSTATVTLNVDINTTPTGGGTVSLELNEAALDLSVDGDDLAAGKVTGTDPDSAAETDQKTSGISFTATGEALTVAFGDPADLTSGWVAPTVTNLAAGYEITWSLDSSGQLVGNLIETAGNVDHGAFIYLALTNTTADAGGAVTPTVTVTLADQLPHLDGDGTNATNPITISGVQVVATDTSGDQVAGSVNISIIDDIPTVYDVVANDPITVHVSSVTVTGLEIGFQNSVTTSNDPNFKSVHNDSDPQPDEIWWGYGSNNSSQQSGYAFKDNEDYRNTANPLDDSQFILGTFTHHNNPLNGNAPTLDKTELYVKINVVIDGQSHVVEHVIKLDHNETPNSSNDQDWASRDIITISESSLIKEFYVGGRKYELQIDGFRETEDGPIVAVIHTLEKASSSYTLYATIKSTDSLPTTEGQIGWDYGADGAGAIVWEEPAGTTVTESGGDTVITNEYGTLTINNTTGAYKFEMSREARDDFKVDENQQVKFKYTVTDSDGDPVDGYVTININGIQNVPTVFVVDGEVENTTLANEMGLATSASMGIGVDPEASGLVSKITGASESADMNGAPVMATVKINGVDTQVQLKSGGVLLKYVADADGNLTAVKTGSNTPVFKVTGNAEDGTYSVEMLGSIDPVMPGTSTPDTKTISFSGTNSVTANTGTTDFKLSLDGKGGTPYRGNNDRLGIDAPGSSGNENRQINYRSGNSAESLIFNFNDLAPGVKITMVEFGTNSFDNSEQATYIVNSTENGSYTKTWGNSSTITITNSDGIESIELGAGNSSTNYSITTMKVTYEKLDDVGSDLLLHLGATVTDDANHSAWNSFTVVIDNSLDGDNTLTGTKDNDALFGGAGDDILIGGDGNDILVGGKGNDELTGGKGDDTFKWETGDQGTPGTPAEDIIMDFGLNDADPKGNDILDLGDLLDGESYTIDTDGNITSSNLDKYLHFAVDGDDTVLSISTGGKFDTNATSLETSKVDQVIVLKDVNYDDLAGGGTTQAAIINQLIEQGKLQVDQ